MTSFIEKTGGGPMLDGSARATATVTAQAPAPAPAASAKGDCTAPLPLPLAPPRDAPPRARRQQRKRQPRVPEGAPGANKRKRGLGDPGSDKLLDRLPQRAASLDQHVFVAHLPAVLRENVRGYLLRSFPRSPEVAAALLDHVAVHHPTHLRVKELFETIEAVKHAGNHVHELLQRQWLADDGKGKDDIDGGCTSSDRGSSNITVSAIYDLACGHGLGGVLMAYRFPMLPVVCADRTRRPCFDSYLAAFAAHGHGAPLTNNLSFVEGDVTSKAVAGSALPHGAYIFCVHGCNEMSVTALALARRARAGYCVLPCCIRDEVFGVKTRSARGRWFMDDDTRYAVQVGFLAGKSGADKVCKIDRRITNRHLALVGDYCCSGGDGGGKGGRVHDDEKE